MHGLINRSIERFVRDTYGRDVWIGLTQKLDLGFTEFESMLTYDDELTARLLDELSSSLDKPTADVLEDIGTYLVSHPSCEALRRLLRFSGVNFVDFLHSLDDLPARTQLAVSDLDLPGLELREFATDFFCLTVHSDQVRMPGFGHVVTGLLRAMADDYGALVFLEHKGGRDGREIIDVRLLETAFASGRDFELGVRAG
ncbi:heme NO-binding domain-containing protein [uncultured Roseovarius sp.]|uniref:heme NO-binding domain-containing protein n=1 Tax=uncultured Roseovarius sp. TaxID=293344 RepID=UPI00260AF642|nr:heme NO-binding domain-containing protein [uncultured Roseovarius sp.]